MNISRFRKARGLSQRDLAEMMDVDQSTVQSAETAHKSTKLATLQAYALALDVTLEDLLSTDRSEEETRMLQGFRNLSTHQQDAVLHFLNEIFRPSVDASQEHHRLP